MLRFVCITLFLPLFGCAQADKQTVGNERIFSPITHCPMDESIPLSMLQQSDIEALKLCLPHQRLIKHQCEIPFAIAYSDSPEKNSGQLCRLKAAQCLQQTSTPFSSMPPWTTKGFSTCSKEMKVEHLVLCYQQLFSITRSLSQKFGCDNIRNERIDPDSKKLLEKMQRLKKIGVCSLFAQHCRL